MGPVMSSNIVQFRPRPVVDDTPEIDLVTAVDVAIRDLREIGAVLEGVARSQAETCRKMLERALAAEIGMLL